MSDSIEFTDAQVTNIVIARMRKFDQRAQLLQFQHQQYDKIDLAEKANVLLLFHIYAKRDLVELEKFETDLLVSPNIERSLPVHWKNMPKPFPYDTYDYDSVTAYVVEAVARRMLYLGLEANYSALVARGYGRLNLENHDVLEMMKLVFSKDELSIVGFENMTMHTPWVMTGIIAPFHKVDLCGITRTMSGSAVQFSGITYAVDDGVFRIPFDFPAPFSADHARQMIEPETGTDYNDMTKEQKLLTESQLRLSVDALIGHASIPNNQEEHKEVYDAMKETSNIYMSHILQMYHQKLSAKIQRKSVANQGEDSV